MIHEIGRELQARLQAKGCSMFAVVDGPEPTETATFGRERIVLEHDEDAADTFVPVRSQHGNPKHRATRTVAYKLTIYAQSNAAGALEWEHRRRANDVLDRVVCALAEIASARKNGHALVSGSFSVAKDLAGSEVRGGAKYELKFTFDRAVMDRTWAGDARPVATIGAGGIASVTKVSGAHQTDDHGDPNTPPATAETACGE